nr:Chain C, Catenin beta-1 [Homo sapiens]
TTAPSLSGK